MRSARSDSVSSVKGALLLLIAAAACGDKPSTMVDGGGDGGGDTSDASSTCSGMCKQTNVSLMFMNTRNIDVAYYGTMFDSSAVRIEGYKNAAPGCPTGSSPTPDYTLIVGEVATDMDTSPMSTANVLDFKGDLLGGPLGLAATMRQVTRVAWVKDMFIAVDVNLTFSSGTAMGHIYATHCTTLDM